MKKQRTYAWLKRHPNYGERFYGASLQNALRREHPELFEEKVDDASETTELSELVGTVNV